jgi:hypothetical protein
VALGPAVALATVLSPVLALTAWNLLMSARPFSAVWKVANALLMVPMADSLAL